MMAQVQSLIWNDAAELFIAFVERGGRIAILRPRIGVAPDPALLFRDDIQDVLDISLLGTVAAK